MEQLYIKIENNKTVNHPLLESNLLQIYDVPTITEEFLLKHGYAKFENPLIPEGKVLVEQRGYELCEDGIARPILIVQELTQEQKVNEWVRAPRNYFLSISDWTQFADSPLTPEKKAEWAEYRQKLRDLPSKYADIQSSRDVVLPDRPQ